MNRILIVIAILLQPDFIFSNTIPVITDTQCLVMTTKGYDAGVLSKIVGQFGKDGKVIVTMSKFDYGKQAWSYTGALIEQMAGGTFRVTLSGSMTSASATVQAVTKGTFVAGQITIKSTGQLLGALCGEGLMGTSNLLSLSLLVGAYGIPWLLGPTIIDALSTGRAPMLCRANAINFVNKLKQTYMPTPWIGEPTCGKCYDALQIAFGCGVIRPGLDDYPTGQATQENMDTIRKASFELYKKAVELCAVKPGGALNTGPNGAYYKFYNDLNAPNANWNSFMGINDGVVTRSIACPN